MIKVMPDSRLLLLLRILGLRPRIALRRVEPPLVLTVPALQRILGRVSQLTNGRPDALVELDIQLDRSNLSLYEYMNYLLVVPVFVRIPRGSGFHGTQQLHVSAQPEADFSSVCPLWGYDFRSKRLTLTSLIQGCLCV